jgi:prepilin-type N-terminal cleavage/methylation domain-containing protein
MCQEKKPKTAPRTGSLAVDWHDCAWIPAIIVQTPSDRQRLTNPLPGARTILHTVRQRSTSFKIMKMPSLSARRPRAGFTLIELLVVIAIIGILAAMLLAVLPGVMNAGKKTKAKLEAQAIATAIEQYDSTYGRFPVSSDLQKYLQSQNWTGDFTYGGSVFSNANFSPMSWTNNSEVIAILMNLTNYPNGSGATANVNYQKNPQKTIFLNAKMSGWNGTGTPQPGVGNDLVYRDPWGNPYIITMDLNYDDQSQDAFYSLNLVSSVNQTSANPGLNGLVNPDTTQSDNFRYHGKVMVWSAGKSGKIDIGDPANRDENKGHVLSW